MNEIRAATNILLPSSKIKYGLFYRYLFDGKNDKNTLSLQRNWLKSSQYKNFL